MITFIILAAVMVLAAAALIAVPLLGRRGAGAQAPWTAFVVLGVLVAGAAALYGTFSNWNWAQAAAQAAAQAHDTAPQNMVSTLARRLAKNPQDLQGWLLLGRSYSVLEETPLAVRAYERANQLAQGGNVDALLGLAEELVTQDESQLTGRAGELIEKALALDPQSPQALFYGAAVAIHRRDFPLARARFVSLLALDPPDNVKQIIQQQIAAIDAQSGTGPAAGAPTAAGAPMAAAGSTGPGGAAGADDAAAPTADSGQAPAAAAGAAAAQTAAGAQQAAVIRITVTLSPKLKLQAGSSAPLFVFVRDPRQAGPPLAVKRLPAQFPQTVELSSSDAMIPGRAFTPGQDVEVVARIARSGGPIAKAGDPYGEIAYHVGSEGLAAIVIDHLTP